VWDDRPPPRVDDDPAPTMTYSIVARDRETGELGVAVQSHWFAAGDLVMWAEPSVGAVATQSLVEVSHGPEGLRLMREGKTAPQALAERVAGDEGESVRQIAMVDAVGRVAVHTGAKCIAEAGHRIGDGYTCQANMMMNDTVWDAMAEAFERSDADLAHRLLEALDAAEAEGGDVRGRRAAGILVVRAEPRERSWENVLVNMRVDDHPTPLPELRRLVDLKVAYDRLDSAEKLELGGDLEGAFAEQRASLAEFPDNAEFAFWTATSLAAHGRVDEARRIMRIALDQHRGWDVLLRRLVRDGYLDLPREAIEALLPELGGQPVLEPE
jgi:uncharacterized Ntn-hydrolase superfamily protein